MEAGSCIIFDVETTGTVADFDQIIELCIQFSLTDSSAAKTWRFKPEVPINPAAQAVHGISAEDLVNCPPFHEHSSEIAEYLEQAKILVGYNVKFDLQFLLSEFKRAKLPAPDLSEKLILDPFYLWAHFEPRTLSGAHKKFVGSEFSGAHSATEDVAATARVLNGMLSAFDLTKQSWEDIAKLCGVELVPKSWIGPSNHFIWQQDDAIFGFGKHRGKSILTVAKSDNGSYVDWMLKKDFPKHVIQIAEEARTRSDEEFYQWLKKQFPRN